MSAFLSTLALFTVAAVIIMVIVLLDELSLWLEYTFGVPPILSFSVTFVLPLFLSMWFFLDYTY